MDVRRNRLLIGIIVAVIMVCLAFTGGILFAYSQNDKNPILAGLQLPQTNPDGAAGDTLPGIGPDTIADTVASVGPAVVKIVTVTNTTVNNPFFDDPFFRQFFGQNAPPETRQQEGMGSGFLISADGYLLTNEHVIEGAQKIQVTIMGKSKAIDAQVVGSDRELDLAVLKIDAGNDLPYLKMGDSEQIRAGNWVIAIGNPYGLDHTVTVGVISAKGRPIDVEDRHYRNLLQTDASINPGNSGGPLMGLNGEVIGINCAVSAQAQGIGFAIPINTVKDVVDDLITSGHVSRAWLGVEIQDITQDAATDYGYSGAEGVVVRAVVSGGPAAGVGIKEGDVIITLNDAKVVDTDDLLQKIQKAGIGSTIKLTIWRDRQQVSVNVKLEERTS